MTTPIPAADIRPTHFRWTVEDRVATITLDRPERKNPLTFEMYDELRETVTSLNVTAGNAVEITDRINRGHGTIGRLVADDALYDQAEGALRGVTRATQGIEDQAPISVLGTLLGTLF